MPSSARAVRRTPGARTVRPRPVRPRPAPAWPARPRPAREWFCRVSVSACPAVGATEDVPACSPRVGAVARFEGLGGVVPGQFGSWSVTATRPRWSCNRRREMNGARRSNLRLVGSNLRPRRVEHPVSAMAQLRAVHLGSLPSRVCGRLAWRAQNRGKKRRRSTLPSAGTIRRIGSRPTARKGREQVELSTDQHPLPTYSAAPLPPGFGSRRLELDDGADRRAEQGRSVHHAVGVSWSTSGWSFYPC